MRGPSSSSGDQVARAINEDQRKSSEEWQLACWQRWPRHDDWPGKLDLYETSAYLRVHPATIRRETVTDRANKAALPHQRIGAAYRFDRRDLDAHGRVERS